jgi:hypothetical protein
MFTYTTRHSVPASFHGYRYFQSCNISSHYIHSLLEPPIMASLPVQLGTLLFALNLSNYLLPDGIGLAWRLCLARHGAGLGLLICVLNDPDEYVWTS